MEGGGRLAMQEMRVGGERGQGAVAHDGVHDRTINVQDVVVVGAGEANPFTGLAKSWRPIGSNQRGHIHAHAVADRPCLGTTAAQPRHDAVRREAGEDPYRHPDSLA